MSEAGPPSGPPPEPPPDPEYPSPEFLPPDGAFEEPRPESWWRVWFGGAWPFFAAAALVAATLAAVYVLLHPRHGGPGGGAEGAPATVTVEEVSLQSEPSPKAAAIAPLSAGQRVTIQSETARWVEVEADGRRGFLPAESIERDTDRDARDRRAKTLLAFAPVYGVVAEDADVVLAPYPLAARGGRLNRGAVIAIHSVDHSYFAFADKKWGVAFVDSARVDLVPPDPREPAVTPEKVRPLKDLTVVDLAAEPPPEEDLSDLAEGGAATPRPGVLAPGPPIPAEPAPGLLESPSVLTRVDPIFPDAARRAGIEGTVELEVSIDATGKVTDVEVARGLPFGLSESAVDAVRRWTWKPARTASGPVASRKTVRVKFVNRLEDEH
ncbi:MAG TPA: TonB family protein [Thermoanaerobaculia bacterium]|nr:TonB family protein [Thermoanaerobaculia bacterium]